MEAAGDGERSSFRCLHAARYVLASVMTVLVVAITFNTVKLVLYERSHDPVQLSVVRGAVVFARSASGDLPALVFYHSIRVSSARGFKYYAANSTACLFDPYALVGCFRPGRTIKAVEQRGQSYFLMEAKGTPGDNITTYYFDALYKKDRDGGSLHYVMLRLEGAFVAVRRSGWNTTSRNVYYCEFLTISGLYSDEAKLLDHRYDVPCRPLEPEPEPIQQQSP